ncbi:MAG: hypothetical protein ACOC8L_10250, partial [Spirochaetota bacterium]
SFTAREIFSPLGMTRTTCFLGEVPEPERGSVAAPYFAGAFRRPYGTPTILLDNCGPPLATFQRSWACGQPEVSGTEREY